MIELFWYAGRNVEHEYIVSTDVFDALREQYSDECVGASGKDRPIHLEIRLYEGDVPYGLFISEERLALAAYDEVGRMRAVVESINEEAVEWGVGIYETYKNQSTEPETGIPSVTHDAELMN